MEKPTCEELKSISGIAAITRLDALPDAEIIAIVRRIANEYYKEKLQAESEIEEARMADQFNEIYG